MSEVRITTQTKQMTQTEVYKQLVGSVFDSMRSINDGRTFYPNQLGGISGQREVAYENTILDVTKIEG